MKQLESLVETGVYETLAPSKAMTVRDLLKELNLSSDGLLTVLVNGKKAGLDDEITPKDEICMIPMIAGGQETPMERLKWLLESFDKKYVETLFEEGEKVNLFPPNKRENYKYPYNGWVYTISRYKALDPQEQLLKRMGL